MSLLLKHLIPYVTPIIVFVLLEVAFAQPAKGWLFLIIALIIGLAGSFYLIQKKVNKKNAFLLLPGILFFLTFLLFFFFLALASSSFKHIFTLLIIIFWGLSLEATFQFYHSKKNTADYADFLSYGNILTVFMFFTALGSMQTFLNINSWLLVLMATIFSSLIFYSNYYTNSFKNGLSNDLIEILNQKLEDLVLKNKSEKILFTAIPTLVLVEIFWTLYFLPTNNYVNGFILTTLYYLIAGILKNRLRGTINSKLVKKYLLISGLCLLLIILTARV